MRPPWFDHSLEVQYRAAARQVERETGTQMALANKVSRICLAEDVQRPLFFKGFTNFARTNNIDCLHQSGDIDMFAASPADLANRLASHGYDVNIVKCNPLGIDHEYAQFCQKGAEIHNFFPVFPYPKGIENENIDPNAHPGTWYQNTQHEYKTSYPSVRKIFFEDVIDDATISKSPQCPDTLVPSPATAAFLQCCHLHREMCFAPPCGVASLYELAAINDSLQDPDFSSARFLELVSRFDSWAMVAAIGALLEDCFGVNRLPIEPTFSKIPFCTVEYAGWIGILPRPRRIILPFSLKEVVTWLGSNQFALTESIDENVSWTDVLVDRKMVMLNGMDELPFVLQAKLIQSELSFRVRIPKSDLDNHQNSSYQFGIFYTSPRTPKWIICGKESDSKYPGEFFEPDITLPLQGVESYGVICLFRITPRENLLGHIINSFFYIPFSLNVI